MLDAGPRRSSPFGLMISQLQVAFLKFHNAVVDYVRSEIGLTGGDVFPEAQRIVRWHYQWIVVHEYLRKTCGDAMVDDVLRGCVEKG